MCDHTWKSTNLFFIKWRFQSFISCFSPSFTSVNSSINWKRVKTRSLKDTNQCNYSTVASCSPGHQKARQIGVAALKWFLNDCLSFLLKMILKNLILSTHSKRNWKNICKLLVKNLVVNTYPPSHVWYYLYTHCYMYHTLYFVNSVYVIS